MRLTPPRQLMLATAVMTLGGALWLSPQILDGDAVAFAIAAALLAVCGFSVGFVGHGVLTDRIIDRCRRVTEQHHALAAATLADWRRHADVRFAALEAQLDDLRSATVPSPSERGEPPCRSASGTTSS